MDREGPERKGHKRKGKGEGRIRKGKRKRKRSVRRRLFRRPNPVAISHRQSISK